MTQSQRQNVICRFTLVFGAAVNRPVIEISQTHPAIRDSIANYHADIVREVQSAIATNNVVVVGMRQNPFPKRARKSLDTAGIPYKYLEYGSYFSEWKPRLALKMWSGWPTLPMIFVKGTLIGGATDLDALIKSGELGKLLGK
jgi:glutaredoxin-related protein